MFSTPLTMLFYRFWKARAALEGETKKDECRVRLGATHLEVRITSGAPSVRIYESNGISGEQNVVHLTELTLWEKLIARILVRRLHNYSRANVRSRERSECRSALKGLPCL